MASKRNATRTATQEQPTILDQTTAVKGAMVRVQRAGAEDLVGTLASWGATQLRVQDANGKRRVFTPATVVVYTVPGGAAAPAPASATTTTAPRATGAQRTPTGAPHTATPVAQRGKAAPATAPAPAAPASKGPRTVKGTITDPTNGGTTAPRHHLRPVHNAKCKAWALANGFTTSASGHVRKAAIDAYLAAHPQVGVSVDAKLVEPTN